MHTSELFVRLQAAYEASGCFGSVGHFLDACARFYGKDARLLDNSDLLEHAECYARKLKEHGR